MLTQEVYNRTHCNNSEGLPFLRGSLALRVKKRNENNDYNIWIWSSEYQFGKLRQNDHFFIDETFGTVPSGYQQLVDISIIDKITDDVLSVCWILTNSKDYQYSKYIYHLKQLVIRSNKIK